MQSFILKGLGKMFAGLFKYLPNLFRFSGIGFAGLFLLSTLIIEAFTIGIVPAFQNFAFGIFGAELVINQNVTHAIMNSPEYNLHAFFGIITGLIILYSLVKWGAIFLERSMGANKSFGAYIITILIIAVISTSVAFVTSGSMGFFSIRDSIVYLIVNIEPVLQNIF